MQGDLDAERFRKAWLQMIARHPVLRTLFLWEELETPRQVVLKPEAVQLPWGYEDWCSLTELKQMKSKG